MSCDDGSRSPRSDRQDSTGRIQPAWWARLRSQLINTSGTSAVSDEPVERFLRAVPIDDTMGYLARICAYDRYQASRGIGQAAEFVAETARAIGLSDVRIERFPADGRTSWWTFQAPVSWTPTTACLTVFSQQGRLLEIDHERQPFSIA